MANTWEAITIPNTTILNIATSVECCVLRVPHPDTVQHFANNLYVMKIYTISDKLMGSALNFGVIQNETQVIVLSAHKYTAKISKFILRTI